MRFIRGTILFLFLFFSFTSVSALDNTQQYNKIFLNPFYRVSLNSNTNYTYNVTVNPPDKIGSVLNAIMSFNAQINGQTQSFSLWVNGNYCNPSSYSVATAFSTTGNVQFYFDCSDRIKKPGVYNVTLQSSVNTGAIVGWLDFTYTTNQSDYVGTVGTVDRVDNVSSVDSVTSVDNVKSVSRINEPKMTVHGTEYSPGDPATMFVQLKDSYGNPVQNGVCYLDVWYPNNGTTHPYTIQDAPMLQALGDDGIYYYDMSAPSQLGVYMLSARCAYSYNWIWIYPELEFIYSPTRTPATGGSFGVWSGSTVNLNSRVDNVYDSCLTSGSGTCLANYTFNLSQYGAISNITSINMYYLGEATAARVLTMSYWNGTSMNALPNTLTYVATGSTTAPSGVDLTLTNVVPLSAIIGNTVKLQFSVPFVGTGAVYNNWLSLALLTSSGTIQDVRGSSEMHITNIANITTSLVNQNIPFYVWNYTSRNLTYYPRVINESVINDIWSLTANRTLTDSGVLWVGGTEYDVNETLGKIVIRMVSSSGVPVTGGTCSATLMYPNMSTYTNLSLIEITARAGMYYANFTVPKTLGLYSYGVDCIQGGKNYYLADTFHIRNINNEVWINPVVRNLTQYNDMTNYTKVAENVWSWSGDIVTNILDKFATYIWQAMGGKAEVLT
jgi:hypothetical protein